VSLTHTKRWLQGPQTNSRYDLDMTSARYLQPKQLKPRRVAGSCHTNSQCDENHSNGIK